MGTSDKAGSAGNRTSRRRFLQVSGLSAAALTFLGVTPAVARDKGAIVGEGTAWGETMAPYQPYTVPMGAIDTIRVRAREHLDIHGLGTDLVELQGTFVVKRDHPRPYIEGQEDFGQWTGLEGPIEQEWGKAIIFAQFVKLDVQGTSGQFGSVRVTLAPNTVTEAIVQPVPNLPPMSKACAAELYPNVWLMEMDLLLSTGPNPVPLESRVIAIPPTGDVARSTGAVPLYDGASPVGTLVAADIEVGQVIDSVPL